VLDFLTLQLDRELIFHNVMVSNLKERMCGVFLKSTDTLKEIKKLRNEKLDLEMRLLGRLEEGARNISELQEKIASNQLEIATFREVIDRK